MKCQSCEMLAINGIPCHETGCPDAWKDETRECKWCGQEFKPKHFETSFCCNTCYQDFFGLD